MAEKKHSVFNLFYSNKMNGKGVKKEKKRPMDLINFFRTLPRRFSKLVSVNLLIIVGSFPLIFPLIAMSGLVSKLSYSPAYDMFGAVYNLYRHCPSPAVTALWGIFGIQAEVHIPTTTTIVFYALGLLTVFTLGPLSTGVAYLLRNLARGESISTISDFFYALKRNFRQSLIVGIIDSVMIFMLGWDILTFYYNSGTGTMMGIFFFVSLIMAVVYFFMRFYVYLILVTFDLSVFKIFKNALIFSFLGIWRNLAATVGIVILAIITLWLGTVFFPLMLSVIVICGLSLAVYMTVYAAWPKIKSYMIDPYYKDEEEEHSYFDEEDDEPICRDDVGE